MTNTAETETSSEPSGKDAARQALANWKAIAKQAPATKATHGRKKHKRSRAQYGDSRDFITLGAAIDQLTADGNLKAGTQGGSIRARWNQLCPEGLRGKVEPIGYDKDRACLLLKPANPTVAAYLRTMYGPTLVKHLQEQGAAVRAIRVANVGAIADPAPQEEKPAATALEAPVKTRETACEGYRAALAAHQAHAVRDHGNPELLAAIRAAAARPPMLREDEEAFAEAEAFEEDLREKAARAADVERRAREMARRQKAGRMPEVRTAFQRTA